MIRTPRTLAVVGAGISGLAAAYAAVAAHPELDVTVFDAADSPGGCLSRTELGGFLPGGADDGAEASLSRRPETRELVEDLGLTPVFPSRAHGSRLITAEGSAGIPAGTLMGVPADPDSLKGILSAAGVERIRHEVLTPPVDDDASCGDFLAARLGDELVDRVVDPLIGGVYAGRCRDLSLAQNLPALLPAARAGTPVLDAVAEVLAARTRTAGADIPGAGGTANGTAGDADDPPPVFLSLEGGINQLVSTLVDRLTERGVAFRTQSRVHAVNSAGRLRTDSGTEEFDQVVIALPAWAAQTVLSTPVEDTSAGTAIQEDAPAVENAGVSSDLRHVADLVELLGRIDYATSAVITAVFRDDGGELEGSGFLVPPVLGGLVKASTFSSNKWPWLSEALPDNHRAVRVSVGRMGDESWMEMDDASLIDAAFSEWRALTGYDGSLMHTEVRRWVRALPQYRPGHTQLVEQIDAACAQLDRIVLAGNYLAGVGVPACIGRAQSAVAELALST